MPKNYISFSNKELAGQPILYAGGMVKCPKCKRKHKLTTVKDVNGRSTEILLFYKCGESSYLAAIDNFSIMDK